MSFLSWPPLSSSQTAKMGTQTVDPSSARRGIRLLMVICAIVLAWVWVLLGASPAWAMPGVLNYNHAELNGQDFSQQDLTGVEFVAAEMRGVNLSGANLKNAMLTKANLLGANLANANLQDALIDRVTLYQADLTNANLVGATLSNSILVEATITGADFTDAIIDRYTLSKLCAVADGVNSVTGADTRESLGCRS